MKHEVIATDLINIVNVEKDGNCFYRVISYFLYNNQNKYNEIRNKIKERAREMHRNNPQNLHLIEGLDLSQTSYLNNRMNNGDFAGDYEISIAHKLYNINIAVYRFKDDNDLSFIKFYNDDGNNKKNLLILVYINDNHYQLAYYKKKEKNKENQIEGMHKLQQDITIKNSINSDCTTTQKETKGKTRTKKTPNEKKEDIIAINEQKVIYCMTRLSSGNLAIGLSNGLNITLCNLRKNSSYKTNKQ